MDQVTQNRIGETCARIAAQIIGNVELMDRLYIAANEKGSKHNVDEMIEDRIVLGVVLSERAFKRIVDEVNGGV